MVATVACLFLIWKNYIFVQIFLHQPNVADPLNKNALKIFYERQNYFIFLQGGGGWGF